MDAYPDLLSLVAANPTLKACSEETRAALVRHGRLRHFADGTLLFADDEPGGLALFLLDGAFQMVKTTCRGRRQIVCSPHATTCGGVCLLMFGEHALAEVRGLEAGRVLIVERAEFESLTQQDPVFSAAAWRGVAHCMAHLHALVSQLSFNKVAERVTMLLVEESGQDGDSIRLTQADLAAMVGTTREVVARCLAGFQADGLIRLGRGRITVLDRAKLRQQI